MRQAQIFLYANGNNQPPTAIDLDKSLLKELLFNQSPSKVCITFFLKCQTADEKHQMIYSLTRSFYAFRTVAYMLWLQACVLVFPIFAISLANFSLLSPIQDVALASVSMRPIPFAPVLEKLSLSDLKYGSVRRFYIETSEDNAIPITVQESMINASPPEQVLRLKGADHSPFFSKPQALHKLLVEISRISSP